MQPWATVRGAISFCAYATGCALLHGLLQHHYYGTCRGSWLALFSLDPGPYCEMLRRGLSTLQWSPMVAAGLVAHRQILHGG